MMSPTLKLTSLRVSRSHSPHIILSCIFKARPIFVEYIYIYRTNKLIRRHDKIREIK